MDIQHPWSTYEVARLRHEERLLRARDAMRILESREASPTEPAPKSSRGLGSLLGRVRPRKAGTPVAGARSEAT
jgi:hypothetical protein